MSNGLRVVGGSKNARLELPLSGLMAVVACGCAVIISRFSMKLRNSNSTWDTGLLELPAKNSVSHIVLNPHFHRRTPISSCHSGSKISIVRACANTEQNCRRCMIGHCKSCLLACLMAEKFSFFFWGHGWSQGIVFDILFERKTCGCCKTKCLQLSRLGAASGGTYISIT